MSASATPSTPAPTPGTTPGPATGPQRRRPGLASGRAWRRRGISFVLHPRLAVVTAALLLLSAALGAYAMTVGSLDIPIRDVLPALLGDPSWEGRVVRDLRLPRVLTALFAGAALGVSGAIFQSVSRNALGSPDVIGFTTGAATGAISQIVLFGGGPVQVAAGAVLGGAGTALIVYLLSVKAGVTGGYRLVLVGIGVGEVLAALNNLMLVKGDLDSAITANIWQAGSLDARQWEHAVPVLAGVLVITPLVGLLARRAALIEMGDELAAQLGVRVERTRILLMAAGVALASLAAAAAGPISFVALAAPQLVVRMTRSRSMPVLSAAAMGAFLLVLGDVASQLLPLTASVPIGRMTGIVGGVYLIWLLTRSRQV